MKMINKTIDTVGSNNFSRIIKGSAISIIITVISLIVFALVLAYSSIPETAVTPVVITVSCVSILIGGMLSSLKIRKQGLINGGLVGLIYVAIIYILSSIIDKDFSLDLSSIIMCLACIGAGAIRGNNWS